MAMLWNPRWSMRKVKRRLLAVEHVYDVMYEVPASNRYLVHVWVEGLTERLRAVIEPLIREAVGRRPPEVKIDVLLYRRDDG